MLALPIRHAVKDLAAGLKPPSKWFTADFYVQWFQTFSKWLLLQPNAILWDTVTQIWVNVSVASPSLCKTGWCFGLLLEMTKCGFVFIGDDQTRSTSWPCSGTTHTHMRTFHFNKPDLLCMFCVKLTTNINQEGEVIIKIIELTVYIGVCLGVQGCRCKMSRGE